MAILLTTTALLTLRQAVHVSVLIAQLASYVAICTYNKATAYANNTVGYSLCSFHEQVSQLVYTSDIIYSIPIYGN